MTLRLFIRATMPDPFRAGLRKLRSSQPLDTSRSSTVRIARAISIFGHPMLVMPLAAWLAIRASGSDANTTLVVLSSIVVIGLIVLSFSAIQVRSGRWQHVDASVTTERRVLNAFLLGLFVVATMLAGWYFGHSPVTVALLLAAAIILFALVISPWCKLSLHVAFGCFAIFVPESLMIGLGFAIFVLAVAWSRLVLGRHNRADILVGMLAGIAAGITFQLL